MSIEYCEKLFHRTLYGGFRGVDATLPRVHAVGSIFCVQAVGKTIPTGLHPNYSTKTPAGHF
jgi:hypothetical protein